jgi:hypothetical protein
MNDALTKSPSAAVAIPPAAASMGILVLLALGVLTAVAIVVGTALS